MRPSRAAAACRLVVASGGGVAPPARARGAELAAAPPRAVRRLSGGAEGGGGGDVDAWAARLHARQQGKGPIVVARTLADMRAARAAMDLLAWRQRGAPAVVGFVPTMGALHAGHLSLVSTAAAAPPPSAGIPATTGRGSSGRSDFVVSSVFVNPTQFAPHEDLSTYPRTWDADVAALSDSAASLVWAPLAGEMYPQIAVPDPSPGAGGGGGVKLAVPFRTFVDLADIDAGSPEGAARPGFFRGVATVVTKLLNAVQPTHAVFGQKDGIQCIVVRTLVRELNLPLHVTIAPTMREGDGLAMSSRNVYLTPPQRAAANVLYAALYGVKRALEDDAEGRAVVADAAARRAALVAAARGGAGVSADKAAQLAAVASRAGAAAAAQGATTPMHPYLSAALARATNHILTASSGHFTQVQYLAFSCGATGRPIADLAASYARGGAVLLSVAAKIGSTRLLDNVVLCGGPDDLGTMV